MQQSARASAVIGKCNVHLVTAPFIVALHVTAGARHLILFGARQLHCIAAQLCFSAHDKMQCNYSFLQGFAL